MVETGSLFERFTPHGMCYQWRPDILWLNVGSDVIIAIAYILIPAGLLYFMNRRSEVIYPALIYLFCIFIFSCGVTHAFGIWTVWNGQYGVQGLIKSFTAAASVATALMLYPAIPKLLALRSARELEQVNNQLELQIDRRKKSQQQTLELQNELARVGRITTVGQMATGLAHEVNQPLLAISASADTAVQVARSVDANDSMLFECLEDIQKETHRASEIIRALRSFVDNEPSGKTNVQIDSLIYQALSLVSNEARNADIEILVEIDDNPFIEANAVQIVQVLVNLVCNAVEAMAGSQQNPARERQIQVQTKQLNGELHVSVADTGPGIAADRDPFLLFESDKDTGMGVGLSICKDIVTGHNGTIKFSSDGTSGATFTICLPVSAEPHMSQVYTDD